MAHDEEMKYEGIAQTLKTLKKVDAPEYFNANLMRKINSLGTDTTQPKQSFWDRLLSPSRLIPSAALAVTAVIILFVVNLNPEVPEDPLLSDPRAREDFITSESPVVNLEQSAVAKDELKSEKTRQEASFEQQVADNFRNEQFSDNNYQSRAVNVTSDISKSGLNFRQVYLNESERNLVNQLKQRIMTIKQNR